MCTYVLMGLCVPTSPSFDALGQEAPRPNKPEQVRPTLAVYGVLKTLSCSIPSWRRSIPLIPGFNPSTVSNLCG